MKQADPACEASVEIAEAMMGSGLDLSYAGQSPGVRVTHLFAGKKAVAFIRQRGGIRDVHQEKLY